MASQGAESSGADEEFLHNLYRGGELLAAGKVIEAKEYLERAFRLQPKNEKGQNLLGLTYFKLGLFDRAAEIYEALVRENPVDPTLRVNLGLVYLKTGELPRAIREFETTVDLAPDHKKAHNYLGLALAQLGNYAEAHEHFVAAGSEAMAQKMERAMAGEATGLHRMPPPLEQQHGQQFAEIEGSEVVAEQGGQSVLAERRREQALPQPPPLPSAPETQHAPPAEFEVQVEEGQGYAVEVEGEQWGAQVEEAPQAAAYPAREDDLRFAEDEGPPALPTDLGGESMRGYQEPSEPRGASMREAFAVMTPEELGSVQAGGFDAPEQAPEEAPEEVLEQVLEQAPEEVLEQAPQEPMSPPPQVPAEEVEREEWTATSMAEVRPQTAFGIPLMDLASSLELLKVAPAEPFEVRPEGVAISVAGELLTRVEGMVLQSGQVRFDPELKRFRGRTTEQPFGEDTGRMMRATGRAVLFIAAPEKRRFEALDLADESAYFREDVVFAFEEAVMFENGRVPSEATGDLDLVHLRGKGKVLLRLDGALRAQRVVMEAPVTVPLPRLVGWFGNLTPRLVPMAVEESGRVVQAGAELSGEGYVLVSAPVG